MSVLSRFALTLADDYTAAATVQWGHFDKLDALPLSGDVLVQFRVQGAWQPEGGKPIRAGIPVSLPGLMTVWAPYGPDAVRFKRRVAGLGATVDCDLWAP